LNYTGIFRSGKVSAVFAFQSIPPSTCVAADRCGHYAMIVDH